MLNKKRGLVDTISCPAMEISEHQTTLLKIWSKRKHKLNPEEPSNRQKLRPQPTKSSNICSKNS